MDRKIFDNSLAKRNQIYNKKNEYETPIAPQLKKMKIIDYSKGVPTQKDELKKLFGFELKEIKKTNSNRPSTEKPAEGNQNPVFKLPNTNQPPLQINFNVKQLQQRQQQPQYQNKNQYWGRGYHLNYPNYV